MRFESDVISDGTQILHLSVKSMNAKLNGKAPITVEEANMIAKIADISNPSEIFFADSVA